MNPRRHSRLQTQLNTDPSPETHQQEPYNDLLTSGELTDDDVVQLRMLSVRYATGAVVHDDNVAGQQRLLGECTADLPPYNEADEFHVGLARAVDATGAVTLYAGSAPLTGQQVEEIYRYLPEPAQTPLARAEAEALASITSEPDSSALPVEFVPVFEKLPGPTEQVRAITGRVRQVGSRIINAVAKHS